MAEFCTKCFTALNEDGQCPLCGHRNTHAATPTINYAAIEVEEAPAVAPVIEVPTAPVYVARFCMKCGGSLDENGLCPVCDAPAPAPVSKFCMKCGSALGENGLCPICDAPAPVVAPAPNFCMKCGGSLDVNGLCPVCDAPAPVVAPAPNFCMKCGGSLDENGLCPICDAPTPMADLSEIAQTAVATEEQLAEAPIEEKKKDKKPSALSVIATILLSLCLFVTMLASVGIITVRNTVSEGSIYNLTEELDVAQLLKTSGVAEGNSFDELYMRLERDYGVKMDDDKLAELIEESTLPAYVSDKAGEFSSDFFSGDAELVITKAEMTELVADNLDLLNDAQIEGYTGGRIQADDCDEIADWLFNGDELVLISTDSLEESSPALYQTINICLSWVALAFFLLLSALIGFVMCRNSLSQAAIGGGVVFILLGGLTALAAAVVAWIPSVWASIAGNNMILSIVGSLLTINGLIFAILFVLGVAMLVTRAIVKHSLKKKA